MKQAPHITVYNYEDPRQFLLDYLADRQKQDPEFSVRRWAREMGMNSHALLVMLLQGKRPLRVNHVPFLAKGMNLPSQERLYLQALIQFAAASSTEEKALCNLWLSDLNPGGGFRTKEVDQFLSISHWLYTAILAMTDLHGFDGTEESIARRLRGRVTVHEVRGALQRLLHMNLLERDSKGRLCATYQRTTTRDDIANEGARKYHRATSELAMDSVEEVPLDRREFQSFSMAVNHDKIPLAKEMIRKFRTQLAKAIASDAGDEVYQMNIQLFQLTESPAHKSAEDEGTETGLKRSQSKEVKYV